jgi:hypothetical protein
LPLNCFAELADVLRAEADDDARVVEILGIDVDQADVAADVARGGDDELQQPARGGLRFCARVEARFLAHDRQQQRGIGVVTFCVSAMYP